MKRVALIISLLFVLLAPLAMDALAVSISYTDTTSAPASNGNEILYSLTLTGSGTNWEGFFSISNTANVGPPEYFADWATFKFVDGQMSAISNLIPPVGTWSVANSQIDIYKGGEITADSDVKSTDFNALLAGNSVGFFVSDFQKPDPFSTSGLGGANGILATAMQNGVPVTGIPNSAYTFSFDLTLPSGEDLADNIPFQIGYFDVEAYGNGSARLKVIQGQLSKELEPSEPPPPGPPVVPEPGTLVLLGTGMVIIGAWIKAR